jgi:hypothetical protein
MPSPVVLVFASSRDAAVMLGNFRIKKFAAQRLEALVRAPSSAPISRE